jgi:pimeloyl-ACP methyl ester carboxylesterase
MAPIGADRSTTREAYAQLEANALRSGRPGADTVSILHRYGLDQLAERQPDDAVRQLHKRAMVTGERELLFTLAELSYAAAADIRRSLKPWDSRDARDYYLGCAIYAWLFLFGDGEQPPPSPFDRRFREACDFYNYALGLALVEPRSTNAVVHLTGLGHRALPVGKIELRLDAARTPRLLEESHQILLADQFRVRGLSVRNRGAGLGTPLICLGPVNPEFGFQLTTPVSMVLRGPASLNALGADDLALSLELYPVFNGDFVAIAGAHVPLEIDLTAHRAYALNQSKVWKLGKLQFLAPAEHIRSQLVMHQPLDPDRIPLVFVHGTFSSPVTWAEMANTLVADAELRGRYQIWSFVYGSGNPLAQSVAEFRTELASTVTRLDPHGTNRALRQMVIVGHSQGGLLTKATVVDSGDRIWRLVSDQPLEAAALSEAQRATARQLFFYQPLPFVRRVVFVATPHRGSYLSGRLARSLARSLVSLPRTFLAGSAKLFQPSADSEMGQFLRSRMPTSLDGMSPKNPGLLALAEVPIAPGVSAHSIIPVSGDGDYGQKRDGVVSYASAHLDGVESECIVRGKHSCLDLPATIEEVRRILHLHLDQLPDALSGPSNGGLGGPPLGYSQDNVTRSGNPEQRTETVLDSVVP